MPNISVIIPFFNGGFSDVHSWASVSPGSETVQSAFPRGPLLLHSHRLSEYSFHSFHSLFSHLLFTIHTLKPPILLFSSIVSFSHIKALFRSH